MSRKHIHEPRHIGDIVADAVVSGMGSWRFIIIQSIFLAIWVALNIIGFVAHWDPYPFIFCNLMLSFQAAYASPLILMSQNRASARDRKRDDLEAKEIESMFSNHKILLKLNHQQLEILKLLHDRGGGAN